MYFLVKKTFKKSKNFVLLILAGVTIATLTGENGLLTKAGQAKDAASDAEVKEQILLAYQEYQMEQLYNTNTTLDTFMKNSLEKLYGADKVTVTKMGINVKIEITGRPKTYFLRYDGILKEKENVDPMAATSVYGKLENGTLYLKATEDEDYILYTSSRIIQSNWKDVLKIKIEEPIAPTTCFEMFRGFENCTEIENIEKLHTENSISGSCMFCDCKSLSSLDVSRFDKSKMSSISAMFYGCKGLLSIDVSGFDTSKNTSLYGVFNNCKLLKEIDVSGFNTSNTTGIYEMFLNCELLEKIDASGFDTSKIKDFNNMFNGCKSIKEINVKNFNTQNATNFNSMFRDCKALDTIDVSSFDTSKVSNMVAMFAGSAISKLDLKNFITDNVNDMQYMFANCNNLTELNISNFNTGKVTNVQYMFSGCSKIKKIQTSNLFKINDGTNCTAIVSSVPSDIKITATQSVAEKIIANSSLLQSNFEIIE